MFNTSLSFSFTYIIITNNIVEPPTEHTCKFDGATLELRKFDQQLADRARMSDQGITRLPCRDNIKRRIRKLRHNNEFTTAPNDPIFLSIPTKLCKTQRQDEFLRCDTGPGDDRILIFASNEHLNILQFTHHFMSDGTFRVVPEVFYQLSIIHAIYRAHVIPVISALLRRKDTVTCRRLFNEVLKFAPHWTPHSIMIDYEKACINSYDATFPNNLLSGCYFHLGQNLHHKLQILLCIIHHKQ